jgi:hypothetical protein
VPLADCLGRHEGGPCPLGRRAGMSRCRRGRIAICSPA